MGLTINLPGSVWEDFLDPLATEMQAELGLPGPSRVRRGRGWTARYEGIAPDVAAELADYLRERGELLLGNSDPEFDATERGMYRRAIAAAEKITAELRAAAN